MEAIISEDYRKLNQQLHEERPDYGTSGQRYADMVNQIAMSIQAESILDFGCGKQTLQNALPHMTITGYDPCIPGLDDDPEPADLVVCTDVLEHIEPEHLDSVLDELQRLTQKVLFLQVATRPAKKTLADGRNAHLIVEPASWWLPKLTSRFTLDTFNRMGDGEFIATLSKEGA